jgi:ribosome recycling factor
MIKNILKEADEKMSKAIEHVRNEFVKIRTGKATTNLLDAVRVDYYGNPTPLNQIANVSTPDYHTITVQPWDKTIIPQVEKAVLNANLGLNPSNDGSVIRIPIPALNEERRKEIVKLVKKFAEDGRIAVRNIRRDEIEKIKKEEHISEDEKKTAENEVQKITDKSISEIDNLLSMKEKEIMEV